jgi:hypothetical protein
LALRSNGERLLVYRICLERDDTLFETTLPVDSSGYAPQRNAPALHSRIQDQRYGVSVPYANHVASSYTVWTDAQQSTPFAPVRAMASIAFS